MPKTKISEFSATPGNNTDIDGINISEGCAPSGINDAIRELMAQLKDFQAGTAGDSFNGPVGTTTAAAGAFTTLSASSTVSGAGFSTYLASPPAIGGTAAAAGSFTTLSASSTTTLSGGTANGVAYLNGSKVVTTGSALVYDGTILRVNGSTTSGLRLASNSAASNGFNLYNDSSTDIAYLMNFYNGSMVFGVNNAEQARLTSTGLGIGTSSPGSKLDILSTTTAQTQFSYSSTIYGRIGRLSSGNYEFSAYENGANLLFGTSTVNGSTTERARIDSSGNLGLGVTPSAWTGTGGNIDTPNGKNLSSQGTNLGIGTNSYFNVTWKYVGTGLAARYVQDAGQHQWYTAPSGTAGNAITFTQAMTLDAASGNLGVGATSPTDTNNFGRALDIRSSTGAAAYFRDSDDATKYSVAGFFGADNNAYYGAWGTSTGVLFYSSGSERARITSGGYFKASDAGTYFNSTASYHELRQTADNICAFISSTNATQTQNVVQIDVTRDTTNNTFYALSYYNRTAAAFRFRVADSGNVTNTNNSYGAISDAKMKTDIVDAGSQWADIKGLRFRKFKMKDDPQQVVQLGVVAQEVEQVSPGLVEEHADKDAEGNDLGTTTKSVKTSVLLMKAAVALQEAMARIEQLEAKVASLEAK